MLCVEPRLRHERPSRVQCGPGSNLVESKHFRCSKQARGIGRQDAQPTMRGYCMLCSLWFGNIWGTTGTRIALCNRVGARSRVNKGREEGNKTGRKGTQERHNLSLDTSSIPTNLSSNHINPLLLTTQILLMAWLKTTSPTQYLVRLFSNRWLLFLLHSRLKMLRWGHRYPNDLRRPEIW